MQFILYTPSTSVIVNFLIKLFLILHLINIQFIYCYDHHRHYGHDEHQQRYHIIFPNHHHHQHTSIYGRRPTTQNNIIQQNHHYYTMITTTTANPILISTQPPLIDDYASHNDNNAVDEKFLVNNNEKQNIFPKKSSLSFVDENIDFDHRIGTLPSSSSYVNNKNNRYIFLNTTTLNNSSSSVSDRQKNLKRIPRNYENIFGNNETFDNDDDYEEDDGVENDEMNEKNVRQNDDQNFFSNIIKHVGGLHTYVWRLPKLFNSRIGFFKKLSKTHDDDPNHHHHHHQSTSSRTPKRLSPTIINTTNTLKNVTNFIDDHTNNNILILRNNKLRAIYPGTLWCGDGNMAKNENDYGVFYRADQCCKLHDNCPKSIQSGKKWENLKNRSIFTKSHCDCDRDFYNCLKSVNSIVSNNIGHTYFNVLGPKCFRQEYPIVSCMKWNRDKCQMYVIDETKNKTWQWFDNKYY